MENVADGADGVKVSEVVADTERLPVWLGVGVRPGETEKVRVGVTTAVQEYVRLRLGVGWLVRDGVSENDGVGRRLGVCVPDPVTLRVWEGAEGLASAVGVDVVVGEWVGVGVTETEDETDPARLLLEVKVAVGIKEVVQEVLRDRVCVPEGVLRRDLVREAAVTLCVLVRVQLGEGRVRLRLTVRRPVMERVALPVRADGVTVGLRVRLQLTLAEGDTDGGVRVPVGDSVTLRVGLRVEVTDRVGVRVRARDRVRSDSVRVTVALQLTVRESVPSCEVVMEAVGERVGVAVQVLVKLGV
mmetsp:Transcript_24663/g.44782  ORF Transcript_24663/g.44782 Transcript_24663/m.44782 type:complete len:300 (+) Transcript_24663:366-1265(+)